jgi:glycerophosphoryl diester phosphodiesterase
MPTVGAFRGDTAGLAQENSLAAFCLATALGLRYLYTDIRVTSDGQLMCFHDDTR